MDDLLVAYENQTTGSLWKIIQTSQTDRVRFGAVLALRLCMGEIWCFGLVVAPHLFCPSVVFKVKNSFHVVCPWYVIVKPSFCNKHSSYLFRTGVPPPPPPPSLPPPPRKRGKRQNVVFLFCVLFRRRKLTIVRCLQDWRWNWLI